jgi:alpha-1,2-mannosyltransferase
MKIGVISSSLEAGGAQRVCLKMIDALKEANHEVALITLTKTNWSRVQEMLGAVVKPDEEIVLVKRNFRRFAAYTPLLAAVIMLRIRRKFKFDLLVNSQGDTLPVKADILYVHYPTFSDFERLSINLKYSRSLFWRIYITPYKMMHPFFESYLNSGVLVTNSTFSKRAIKKHTGKNSIVIHPPVDVTAFASVVEGNKRENRVVTCGRYSPEKNYEYVLEVAKLLQTAEFAVVGSFSGEKSIKYYEKLSSIKSQKNLANVELIRALGLKDLLRLYGKAKIYMHAMKNEHFGIAVIEAMAAGLVPVVYRGGGPWVDILKEKQGYHGFSYKTPDEAANIIKTVLANEKIRKKIAERNIAYAKQFSTTLFKEKFSSLIDKTISQQANGQDINT